MKLYPIVLLSLLLFVVSPWSARGQVRAHFSSTGNVGCPPLVVHFSNTSTGSPVAYHWIFDPTHPSDTSNLRNPSWIYTSSGFHDVKLVVWDSIGQVDTVLVTNAVQVSTPPVVRFTASDTVLTCPPLTVHFTNTSDTTGCTPYYSWFIDSAYIHTTDATYTFTVPGYYNISLTETDSCGCSGTLTKTGYVKIDSVPRICFHASDSAPCTTPASVCYSNCTAGGTRFIWNLGDGTMDTSVNPCHTYTSGIYSDTVTAYSVRGCVSTLVKRNYVNVGHVSFGFYTTPRYVCANNEFVCRDTSLPGSHHFWKCLFAPFDSSYSDTPSFNIPAPGSYLISDSTWDDFGCTGTTVNTITVRNAPDPGFTVDHPFKCSPNDTATFTPVSVIGIADYLWRFGDWLSGGIDTSHSPHPTHIYTSVGTHDVSLTITDTAGCVNLLNAAALINVFMPTDTLTVDSGASGGCVPWTIHYTAGVWQYLPYITDSISFGDGTISLVDTGYHTFTTDGDHHIKHYIHYPGSCSDTSNSVVVSCGGHPSSITANVTRDTICPSLPVPIYGACTRCTDHYWMIDDEPYRFEDGFGFGAYYVDTTNRKFFTTGNIKVRYYAANYGCADTAYDSIWIHEPSAGFNIVQPVCSDSLTLKFVNSLTTLSTVYRWDFGDYVGSTDSSPVHTFPHFGWFWVTLYDTVTTTGCYNHRELQIELRRPPHYYRVSDSTVCKDVQVHFDHTDPNYSYYPQQIINFGDGTSDSATGNPTTFFKHNYSHTGIYNVVYQILNKYGCWDTLNEPALVHVTSPGRGFWIDSIRGCAPLSVVFHDSDAVPTIVPVISRRWTIQPLRDTIFGVNADTTKVFGAGNYTVILRDIDSFGCQSLDTVIFGVTEPHAYFSADNLVGCTSTPVTFTSPNPFVGYKWFFGDGSAIDTNARPVHTYTSNGIYSDTLIITTRAGGIFPTGCMDTMVRTNYINISDTSFRAGFTLSDSIASCPPFVVLATNTTRPSSGFYYYNWKYGFDSTTVNYRLANATPVYNSAGRYTLTLVDRDIHGCADSFKRNLVVGGPRGTLTFAPDTVCVSGAVHFHFNAIGITPLDSSYVWSVPPMGVFSTDTPGFTANYAAVGVFHPYVVVDSGGCQVAIHANDSVHVFPPIPLVVAHPPVTCGDVTQLYATGAHSYSWSPSVGLSCTFCDSPLATGRGRTTYVVTGTALSGCHDSVITVVVNDNRRIVFVTGNSHTCFGTCDSLTAGGVTGTFDWSGSALACSSCQTTVVCPVVTSVYTVVATDTFGCKDTGHFKVFVEPLPELSYTPSPAFVCKGTPTVVTARGAEHYKWYAEIEVDCHSCASAALNPPNSLVYTVTGTSHYGCVSTEKVPVTVFYRNPVYISKDTTICPGGVALLSVGGGESYIWRSEEVSPNDAAFVTVHPDTTTVYQVVITENVCFKDTEAVLVRVAPIPVLQLPADFTFIAGSPIQLNGYVSNVTGVTYVWSPADFLSCSHCSSPIATPTENTVYTVTATSGDGCKADTTLSVKLYCDRSQVFVPNTFTPNQDGVNDYFFVSGRGIKVIKFLRVYNRWGRVVFERTDINPNEPLAGWDGSFGGTLLAPDVYTYVGEAICELGDLFPLKGDIAIVR